MDLNQTPRANRLHIGFYGRRNSGKSSLINAFTGQEISIVSDVPGTTTDPVYKAMEIKGLGPVTLIDTAGFDDVGDLGDSRIKKTEVAAQKTDIAVLLFSGLDMKEEIFWFDYFKKRQTPVIPVISRVDERNCRQEKLGLIELSEQVATKTGRQPIRISAVQGKGIDELREALIQAMPDDAEKPSITGQLAKAGDTVMLVMPQDIQAPKGRLILPQVQTIRELLDKDCLVVCVTPAQLKNALTNLTKAPELIISDSQIFAEVSALKPADSRLTSFSVLFAGYKGDLQYYTESVSAISKLTEQSKVLIAECCTHAPLTEDIGRVKIPALLRKKIGSALKVDVLSGSDFPDDLSVYDLIIQCGACMFNRKYVMARVNQAKQQGVPMTNYGIVMAYFSGILEQIAL